MARFFPQLSLQGFILPLQLSSSFLWNALVSLELSELFLNLLKYLSGKIILWQFMTLNNWPVKHIANIWNQFVDNSLSWSLCLFHLEVFLFKLVKFPLEVEVLLLLHDLPFFWNIFVFCKEPFGLVVDEVTEHFKWVLLLNLFSFKKLCNFSYALSNILWLGNFLSKLFFEKCDTVHIFLKVSVPFPNLFF